MMSMQTHNMPLHPAITDEPETTNGLEVTEATEVLSVSNRAAPN